MNGPALLTVIDCLDLRLLDRKRVHSHANPLSQDPGYISTPTLVSGGRISREGVVLISFFRALAVWGVLRRVPSAPPSMEGTGPVLAGHS